jgi:hypothetical protein
MRLVVLCLMAVLAGSGPAHAQDNYEIQVYGSDLVPRGATMVELHTNYTSRASGSSTAGVRSSLHALHETLEVTHGFSEWLEVGFYVFTSADPRGWQWVGNHVRPRLSVPERWHWPVGVSLSQEIGYQRRAYSPDTWTWEIRPIVDRRFGPAYVSLNPVLDRSLKGPGSGAGFGFSPNAVVSLDVASRITVALEYYGAFGPISDPAPIDQTEQQIFPAVNIDFGPDWEFNAGIGVGLTPATDRLLAKMILGRRFGGHHS